MRTWVTDARAGLHHGHGDDAVVVVPDLGHAELGAQEALRLVLSIVAVPQSLISMSTPAGRSSRISESTVFGVGSMMSIEPLVRAHLEVLARLSLYLCGERMTQYTVLLGGQRHRARDLRAGARHRLDDLARRGVDDLVVVGLEPDADLLSRHGGFVVLLFVLLDCGRPRCRVSPRSTGRVRPRRPTVSAARRSAWLRRRPRQPSCSGRRRSYRGADAAGDGELRGRTVATAAAIGFCRPDSSVPGRGRHGPLAELV